MSVHSTIRRQLATARMLIVMLLLCAGFVLPVAAQSITGYVFEDQGYTGGAGRTYATAGTASGVNGVTVELYNNGGNYICNTTTVTNGTNPGYYSFASNAPAACGTLSTANKTYTVRVVNSTVPSNYNATTGLIPVQTFGTCITASCETTGTAFTNYVGGLHPTAVDPGAVTTAIPVPANAQSLAIVELTAANKTAAGINFGFNFFTIVNVNASGQGSLAQFIANANALTRAASPTAIFMLYNGAETTGMNTTYTNLLSTLNGGTGKGFIINMGGAAVPALTAAGATVNGYNAVTNIGGTNPNTNSVGSNSQCVTQPFGTAVASGSTTVGTSKTTLPAWTGSTIPAVEVQNCGDNQWYLNGNNQTLNAMAFHQCSILVGTPGGNAVSGVTVSNNLIGMHADGTISTSETNHYGLSLGDSTAGCSAAGGTRTINHNYVRVNNSGIRNDCGSTGGDIYEYNEITSPTVAQGADYDGILLIGSGGPFNGDLIEYNYIHDLNGAAIEHGFEGGSGAQLNGVVMTNNDFCSNGWVQSGNAPYSYANIAGGVGAGAAASTQGNNLALYEVSSTSTVTVSKNIITNSSSVGVLVESAWGYTISQNSIYLNGQTTNQLGAGIALFNSTNTPNNFSTSGYTGITPNPGTQNPAGANDQMNYPVFTLATYTAAGLRVKGYVGGSTNQAIAGAKIELFISDNADNNQNGQIFVGDGLYVPHGEGQTLVTTTAIISDSQGLFDVTIPSSSFAAGVSITAGTTYLTSTATSSSGSTSEFGPDILVEASALNIQGYVYYDVNHSGTFNLGESWQYGAAVYAVLWDTTKNIQATVGGTGGAVIGAQTIPFGAATDTGFFSFDQVYPGDAYELLLTTTAPAAGGTYTALPVASPPSGWIMVNPSTPSVTFTTSATGPQIITQNFGLFHGLIVSGEIFNDDGAGAGGVANDGKLNGTEPGIPNIVLTATDATPLQLDKETTSAGGTYTLWLPAVDSSQNPVTSVTVTLTQIGGYTATGFPAGTPATGGSYNATTYVFTFTPTWTTTAYTAVNFGFIQSGNIFAPNGQETIVPGAIAIYSHQYSSITGGTVTFVESPAVGQPNYFAEILYTDTGCTGSLASPNATYLAWGTAVPISAGGKVCLLMKEMASPAATFGMQNAVTITATFAYTGGTLANTTRTVVDITTLDTRTSGDLQLVKLAYIDATCANPASPIYLTTVQPAQSGYCVKYQIQATNTGASALPNGFTIYDTVPPYTTLQPSTPADSAGATGCTGLTAGAITVTGSAVQALFTGTMPAGCVAAFVYEVKLN